MQKRVEIRLKGKKEKYICISVAQPWQEQLANNRRFSLWFRIHIELGCKTKLVINKRFLLGCGFENKLTKKNKIQVFDITFIFTVLNRFYRCD